MLLERHYGIDGCLGKRTQRAGAFLIHDTKNLTLSILAVCGLLAAGCFDEPRVQGCPKRLFMKPQPSDDGMEFHVTVIDDRTYPLAELAYSIRNTTMAFVNGTFADLTAGKGPPGVSYHERRGPADELNLDDFIHTSDRTAETVTILQGNRNVGGTWYCQ
jgi:hypothetical protein